jgi:hypothetical protein
MNVYRYLGPHGHVFVGVAVAPTTFVMRNGEQVDRPFGSPVEMEPGDDLVTWEALDHPLLELTQNHPYAPRPRVPRERKRKASTATPSEPTEEQ